MDIDALQRAVKIVKGHQRRILCSPKTANIIRAEAPELAAMVIETLIIGDDFACVIDEPNIQDLMQKELFKEKEER